MIPKSYFKGFRELSISCLQFYRTAIKSNTFGGAQSGADDLVSFQAKKYGETAYILNIPSTPGEYGVMVTNPNSLTEKNMTVYCYTIKQFLIVYKELQSFLSLT